MKKIFILSILFAIVSCNNPTTDTNIYHEVEKTNDVYKVNVETTGDDKMTSLRVIVIDSCEYLIGKYYTGYNGYGYLSHKGNCKYCAERRKRELQNKIKD